MLFHQIPGQAEVKQRLIDSVNNNRISHGQLFIGPEGNGGLALALAYARYIFCTNKLGTDSCGVCSSCVKLNKIAHPDLHLVFPVNSGKEGGKDVLSDTYVQEWRQAVIGNPYLELEDWCQYLGLENKQPIINTAESSEVLRKLSLKSYEGSYKIMLIWKPEKMNLASANKLLKLLEEPPEKTLFLLVTAAGDALLPTIISRLQLVKVPRLKDEEVAQAISSRFGMDGSEAGQLARICEGNLNAAFKQVNANETELHLQGQFHQWMRLCYTMNVPETIAWVDNISTLGREAHKNFLSYGLDIMHQCMMMNYTGADQVTVGAEEFDFVKKFSPFINHANVVEMVDLLNEHHYYVERNANAKILFTDLSFKMFILMKHGKDALMPAIK